MSKDHSFTLVCQKHSITMLLCPNIIILYIGYFLSVTYSCFYPVSKIVIIKSIFKYQLYHVMFAIFATVLINVFTSSPFTAQVKDVMKDVMADLQQTNSEKILLSWVRQSTKNYKDINVVNFSSSWTDGLAFNALIHSHRCCYFMGAFFENHRNHCFHI